MAEIVVVDDDFDVREMLSEYFTAKGHTVRVAADDLALNALIGDGGAAADLFVLDVGLPGRDGFTLARELRVQLDPGIIMLTGALDLVDRVVGLEVGADDYLQKPVVLAELAARIEAVLRRRARSTDGALEFGPYRLDLRAFVLRDSAGKLVELTPMEIDLVAAFATNPGKVMTRDMLMRLAPPRCDDSFDRSIDHRVTRLRRKLEEFPDHPRLIKTVRGAGYVHPPA